MVVGVVGVGFGVVKFGVFGVVLDVLTVAVLDVAIHVVVHCIITLTIILAILSRMSSVAVIVGASGGAEVLTRKDFRSAFDGGPSWDSFAELLIDDHHDGHEMRVGRSDRIEIRPKITFQILTGMKKKNVLRTF